MATENVLHPLPRRMRKTIHAHSGKEPSHSILRLTRPTSVAVFPIYLRITEKRRHRRYQTSIELSRKIDWNKTTQEIRTTEPNSKKWNNELQKLLERVKDIYRDLEEDGIASPEKILEVLEGGEKSFSFYIFAQQCTVDIYTGGAPETYLKYNGFCNKFRDYAKTHVIGHQKISSPRKSHLNS